MSQNAVVKEVVSQGVVRVALMGQLECGMGCEVCHACVSKPTKETSALAVDDLGVRPGDWVEVESNNGGLISTSIIVFLVPGLGLLFGYILAELLGFGVGVCLAAAAVGFWVGALPAIIKDRAIRRKGAPEFTITGYKQA